ncbi:MAG: carbon-nitrogen hydrolase family protein [Microbacteriaceae bacterium]
MTESPTIAVVQLAPTDDTAANLAAIERFARLAAARGASLVVAPEYSSYFSTPMGADWVAAAEKLDGPFVAGLARVARELGIHIVAGMIERTSDSSRISNTLVAVDPAGETVATYRKLHLYDAFGARESEWVVRGESIEPETFGWAGFIVGLQTCYDLRFPEVTRRLVDAGATLVLVPSEWVAGPGKVHHWRTLLTARAIENTVYVAAADHASPVGAGNSMVIDPMGVELVTIDNAVDVAVAELSPFAVERARATNPSLANRRFTVIPRT